MIRKVKMMVSLLVLLTFAFGTVGQAFASTEAVVEKKEVCSDRYQNLVTE